MSVDEEKTPRLFEDETESGTISTPVVKEVIMIEVVDSSDGDDALKLAGTHAHQFDEQYYRRLRRKIVCCVQRTEKC